MSVFRFILSWPSTKIILRSDILGISKKFSTNTILFIHIISINEAPDKMHLVASFTIFCNPVSVVNYVLHQFSQKSQNSEKLLFNDVCKRIFEFDVIPIFILKFKNHYLVLLPLIFQ